VRILVLGATGMLGHEVVGLLRQRFELHATARDRTKVDALWPDVEVHPFEVQTVNGLPPLFRRVRPDVVLNCIGIVKQRPEGSKPISSITVNALFPHELAETCAVHGARLMHISTDCVFSGDLPRPGSYREEDPPDARDLYGRTKLLGEVTEASALTLRTSIIGWELGRGYGLLEWLASRAGERVTGFSQSFFSGLTTRALARVIEAVIVEYPDLSGLYHVSSEPISKLE